MNILITGAGGQLAFDLIKVLSSQHKLFPFTKQELDIRDVYKVRQCLLKINPDVVIHCAAYTKVDQAELNAEIAYQVNAVGTRNVAVAANSIGAKLVYISTDYVFDGNKGSTYTESDQPYPISVYGMSKYIGEQIVRTYCHRYFIMRTAWLYGIHGNNFVKTILQASLHKQQFFAAVDQIGSPTYSLDLAYFISEMIATNQYGTYHAANRGSCSKFEFMKAIFELANRADIELVPSTMEQFKLAAPRPRNSSLDDFAIQMKQLPRFRCWREALEEFIQKEMEGTVERRFV